MERFIFDKLEQWRVSSYRKPLILKGVRQVGKTWILKGFGKRYYKNVAYFNFDENEEYKELFGERIGLRVRFSLENLKLDGDVLNIPVSMADYADDLISLAVKQLN